ncbi:hypothetical protein SprV_0702357000 [Sparganum proliferum]
MFLPADAVYTDFSKAFDREPHRRLISKELDLSFNFVQPGDLLVLGTFSSLRVLRLTGNEIEHVPEQLLKPPGGTYTETGQWFSLLEELHLDGNRLKEAAAIASLSQLPRLRHLNLANNEFSAFPVLRLRGQSFSVPRHFSGKSPENLASENKSSPSPKPKVSSKQPSSHRRAAVKTVSNLTSQRKLPQFIVKSVCRKAPIKGELVERTTPHKPETEAIRERDAIPTNSFYGSLVDYDEVVVSSFVAKFVHKVLKKRHLQRRNRTSATFGSSQLRKSNLRRLQNLGSDFSAYNKCLGSNFSTSSVSVTCGENSLFPCLEKLNLSFNQIRDDEEILPVIVCPNLRELSLEGNPIVTQRRKISREVEDVLVRFCGINVQIENCGIKYTERGVGGCLKMKNARKAHKMGLVSVRPERKVQSKLPSLKKLDVDEALRKQREKDRHRGVAFQSAINMDTTSETQDSVFSDKHAPYTSLDPLHAGSLCENERSRTVEPNNQRETAVDSCFVTEPEVEADAAAITEESMAQTAHRPVLSDLDMDISLSTLPTTMQECLTELRGLIQCDSFHLAKSLKPLNVNKKDGQNIKKTGSGLDLDKSHSPILQVSNPFALQLSNFAAVAMKTENLFTVADCLEGFDPTQSRQGASEGHVGNTGKFTTQSKLFIKLQKNYNIIKRDRLQEARDEVSKIAEELVEDLQSNLQYDLLSSDA